MYNIIQNLTHRLRTHFFSNAVLIHAVHTESESVRIQISSITPYGTAVSVKWDLKNIFDSIQNPLSITVMEDDEKFLMVKELLKHFCTQLRAYWMVPSVSVGWSCQLASYIICLRPIYSDQTVEAKDVCSNFTTLNIDHTSTVDECLKPVANTDDGELTIVVT